MAKVQSQDDSIRAYCKRTNRTYRILIQNQAKDYDVFEIPVKYLYFNIENGRYADRMMRLKAENNGIPIPQKDARWKEEIREILLGRGRYPDPRDKAAAKRLLDDIEQKKQLTPGVVTQDGGVLDGNRRLAVLMELGIEHFDGVLLDATISEEDRWRIEAGLQLGKALQHDYSPVNELLKIRTGLDLFKRMKESGHDPAPGKTAEELVADALYGVSPAEVRESIARIGLIDEYLEWAGIKDLYHLVGDTAERFKEALKIVEAAKNRSTSPENLIRLKAWLFHQIMYDGEEALDNWELRQVYAVLGGDPKKKGKKPIKLEKTATRLWEDLPDPDSLQRVSSAIARARIEKKAVETVLKDDGLLKAHMESIDLAQEVIKLATEEDKEQEPLRLLQDARSRLHKANQNRKALVDSEKRAMAKVELKKIVELADDLKNGL